MSNERTEWFMNRIGKKFYRSKTTCTCGVCEAVHNNGLVINDKMHATYLRDVEAELNAEGFPVRYFDTKDEVREYEKSIVTSDRNKTKYQ